MVIEPEIVVATIGAFSAITVGWIGYLSAKRNKSAKVALANAGAAQAQAEQQIELQRVALDFGQFLSEWRQITEAVGKLFEETNVERFLVLRGFNGITEPRWCTAVLQIRTEGQEPIQYIHYELDEDYKQRLAETERRGYSRVIVKELPSCGIKEVYEAEKVTDSLWAFIDKQAVKNSNSKDVRVITYCSFSTMDPEGLTDDAITRCKILVGRLKGAAEMFHATN